MLFTYVQNLPSILGTSYFHKPNIEHNKQKNVSVT